MILISFKHKWFLVRAIADVGSVRMATGWHFGKAKAIKEFRRMLGIANGR